MHPSMHEMKNLKASREGRFIGYLHIQFFRIFRVVSLFNYQGSDYL